jgi:hypothetical protein
VNKCAGFGYEIRNTHIAGAGMSNRDVNPSQGFKATDQQLGVDWATEETYWRENWRSRPHIKADRAFEFYQPGYRYGFESAGNNRGRDWSESEHDLRSGWDQYEHRGQTTWECIKDAVKDGWHRVTNR